MPTIYNQVQKRGAYNDPTSVAPRACFAIIPVVQRVLCQYGTGEARCHN